MVLSVLIFPLLALTLKRRASESIRPTPPSPKDEIGDTGALTRSRKAERHDMARRCRKPSRGSVRGQSRQTVMYQDLMGDGLDVRR